MSKAVTSPPTVAGYRHGRVPRAVREQQILDVAEGEFIQHGYEGTTVEAVCRAAGISRPVLYEHYGSKDGLYLACVKRVRQQYAERLLALWQSPLGMEEVILKGVELYLGMLGENPRRWLVLFSNATIPDSGPLGDQIYEQRKEFLGMLAMFVRGQAPDISLERAQTFTYSFAAVAEQMGRWWLRNPEVPRERMVAHLADFIAGGLGFLRTDLRDKVAAARQEGAH